MQWDDLINKELEKQVLLYYGEEGNNSLYELIEEMSYNKSLSNRDRFEVAKYLIKELLEEDLICIEEYLDKDGQIAIEPISNDVFLSQIEDVRIWQLDSKPAFVINTTEKGSSKLNGASKEEKQLLTNRLVNSKFRGKMDSFL